MLLLVGAYTAEMGGRATGVGVLRAERALAFEGDAAAVQGSPSWLAHHPGGGVVYAALEGAGTVQAFRRSGETAYAAIGMPAEAGELVCHVAVAPDGGSLVASCWGDGRVVRMTLDAAGIPTDPVIAAAATDPYPLPGPAALPERTPLAGRTALPERTPPPERTPLPERTPPPERTPRPELVEGRTSRAHAAAFLPEGRVATTDAGFDLVRIWRPAPDGLRPDHDVVLPRGCGPRHLLVHPSGHLCVITEHSGEVFVLARAASGRWGVVSGTPVSSAALPGDAAAELAASRDGVFLYAGLRGSDTIATLRVRGAGERVEPVALVESGVHWPRHHLVADDTLLVAGERSDAVAALTLDQRTGVPGRVRQRAQAPSPACLLPIG